MSQPDKWAQHQAALVSRYQGSTESLHGEDDGNRTPTMTNRRGGNRRQPLHDEGSPALAPCNEKLYEAYNDLHSLAQHFTKPFDAPAVLVLGQQSDGKSALVEALMQFQFNHVGGGTKTRRPITLHMKYDPSCMQPRCFLQTDDLKDQEMSLEELQDYIERENARLEAEQQFWSKEIVVKMLFKYCPNLTIIDMPGLISAAPGKKNATLQSYSKQVEAMVRAKIEQKEYIILCLEDTNDWNNATTRKLVMEVDPNLSRTVLVSTKFDTRIPQFARASDVEMFLKPQGMEPSMLGGAPFFTSVPSGRVGAGKDAVFRSHEQFREAVAERELQDVAEIEGKLGRKLDKQERGHIGVNQLRMFLERLLQQRYLEAVPSIVPLLEREQRDVQARLDRVQSEVAGMGQDKLKEKGRCFVEAFLGKLALVLRGTVSAPPDKFGETLNDEHIHGGAFLSTQGRPLPVPEHLPNAHMRLFGGAQFHRAMSEFRFAVGDLPCADVTREEIANACGVDADIHDGVDYVRTACVIAVAKARDTFEPFVHQLGYRLSHVLRRVLPIITFLLQRDGQFLAGHEIFLARVGAAYNAFIDEVEKSCKARLLEDLQSTTRYVTWSLHTKNQKGLRDMLTKVQVPVPDSSRPAVASGGRDHRRDTAGQHDTGGAPSNVLVDLLEHTLWSRQLNATSEEIVAALVCQVFEGIRDHLVQAAELKFNCFFLPKEHVAAQMPIVDSFPARLRNELETAYEEQDVDDVFDVGLVRINSEQKIKSLRQELQQVERLRHKFACMHATLAQQQTVSAVKAHEVDISMMSLTESAGLATFNMAKKGFPAGLMPRTAAEMADPSLTKAAVAGFKAPTIKTAPVVAGQLPAPLGK